MCRCDSACARAAVLPFEKLAVADVEPVVHPHDRIRGDPRLMRAGTRSSPRRGPVRPPRPASAAPSLARAAPDGRAAARSPGSPRRAPTTRLHTPGAGDRSQPSSSSRSAATGTRLRRRLSKMRQRLMTLRGFFSLLAARPWEPWAAPSAQSASRRESSDARGWRNCRNRPADVRTVRYRWPGRRRRGRLRSDRG